MAVSVVTSIDRRAPMYGPMLRDRLPSRPAKPRIAIAVGFEIDVAWMSAQSGELAIRKETRLAPQQTAIDLWHGTDVVSMTVGAHRILVTRGSVSVGVMDGAGRELVRSLLATSAAVASSLAVGTELKSAPAGTPERSLHSIVELLRVLLARGCWHWFLEREWAWSQALSQIRPRLS